MLQKGERELMWSSCAHTAAASSD